MRIAQLPQAEADRQREPQKLSGIWSGASSIATWGFLRAITTGH